MDRSPYSYFDAGFDAGKGGQPAEANPLLFKAWPYDCWRLGWEFGELCRNVAYTPVDEAKLQQSVKTPETQGRVAYAKGLLLTDCPYDDLCTARYDWMRGFGYAASQAPADKPSDKFRTAIMVVGFYMVCAGIAIAALVAWAL